MSKRPILIIESDPLARESTEDMLDGEHEILQAGSHEEGLAQLTSEAPVCAIILAISNRSNDSRFLRRLRDCAPKIPLVIHSGYPGAEPDQVYPEFLKPFRIVRKSDPPERLKEVLASMLDESTN